MRPTKYEIWRMRRFLVLYISLITNSNNKTDLPHTIYKVTYIFFQNFAYSFMKVFNASGFSIRIYIEVQTYPHFRYQRQEAILTYTQKNRNFGRKRRFSESILPLCLYTGTNSLHHGRIQRGEGVRSPHPRRIASGSIGFP